MRIRRTIVAFVVLFAVGLGVASAAPTADAQVAFDTFTVSTRHITTTQRVDLPTAEAVQCGAPAANPVLVSSTSIALEPVITTIATFGPDTIFIGEDETVPYEVVSGETNYNTRTTYETVVTQTYQGIEAGPPCDGAVDALAALAPTGAVAVSPNFTG